VSYFRKISPAEATHLAKDAIPNGQFVNQFFIEGDFLNQEKGFDQQQWQKAIELAAAANPGICVQLRGYWGFRYWKHIQIKPQLINYQGDWDGLSSKGFADLAPFINPRSENIAQIILINQTSSALKENQKALVLFRIHHGICDGAATAHWIQEVFRALRGETLLGSKSTLCELDIVKRTEYPKPSVFRGRCLTVFPKSVEPEKTGCHWVKLHWQHSEQRIVAKLLFILRTIAMEEHGEGRTVFRLTSDLRHYLTKEELKIAQFSNLSGIFDIEVRTGDTVKGIQYKIIKALRNRQDLSVYPKRMFGLANWLPSSLFNLKPNGAKNLHTRGVCNITAMIGYANHIDLDAVSYPNFSAQSAYAIPMSIEDKSVFMSIASSPNGIDVILSAPNALSNFKNSYLLAQRIDNELKALEH